MATGATEFIDHTTADAFIPEIWSKEAIVARQEALVFGDLFTRRFEKDATYGDTIHINPRSHMSATNKAVAGNVAISFETITETNVDLTIGTWDYAAMALETATRVQSFRDLLEFYAPEMGYALAHAIDAVLAGLVDDWTQTVGGLITELAYEDVLRADQYLNDANAPMDGRAIVISPAQKAGFMKLSEFVNADYSKLNGDVSATRKASNLGTWLGYPVYCSTNVEGSNAAGHDNAMFHPDADGLVVQMDATTHKMFDINYLCDKVVVEHLYGCGELRDDHGVWLQGA